MPLSFPSFYPPDTIHSKQRLRGLGWGGATACALSLTGSLRSSPPPPRWECPFCPPQQPSPLRSPGLSTPFPVATPAIFSLPLCSNMRMWGEFSVLPRTGESEPGGGAQPQPPDSSRQPRGGQWKPPPSPHLTPISAEVSKSYSRKYQKGRGSSPVQL